MTFMYHTWGIGKNNFVEQRHGELRNKNSIINKTLIRWKYEENTIVLKTITNIMLSSWSFTRIRDIIFKVWKTKRSWHTLLVTPISNIHIYLKVTCDSLESLRDTSHFQFRPMPLSSSKHEILTSLKFI